MTQLATNASLHDKFIRDYLSNLENVKLHWSQDKNTYFTENFVVNAIKNAVEKDGIIHIDLLYKIVDCPTIKQTALQIAEESKEFDSLNDEFIFTTKYKQHIKQLIINIMKQNSYLTTIKEMQTNIIDSLEQKDNKNQKHAFIQLFKLKKQFEKFTDRIIISLSTNISLRSHWNEQMSLIQTDQLQNIILNSIPSNTAIIKLNELITVLNNDGTFQINCKLLLYLLKENKCNKFKLVNVSDTLFIVSNQFYNLRLKQMRYLLENDGYITNDELLNDIKKYLFKNVKEINDYMDKNIVKNKNNINICKLSNGYINIHMFNSKYANKLMHIIQGNNICLFEVFYNEYIKPWSGAINGKSKKILTQNLNQTLNENKENDNDITFTNDCWIINVIPKCIWNQNLQFITKLFMDKNIVKFILQKKSQQKEYNQLYKNDCFSILNNLYPQLNTLQNTQFKSVIMDILQNKMSHEFKKEYKNRNKNNNDQIIKEWKRLSKIIGKLYFNFECLLLSIHTINVSNKISGELLYYLLETVFSKIINTILIGYAYVSNIKINELQIKNFDFYKTNSFELTKNDRYNILQAMSDMLIQNDWNTIEQSKQFSLFSEVKLLLNKFEKFQEITEQVDECKIQWSEMNDIDLLFKTISKQLLLNRFMNTYENNEEKKRQQNDKFILMYSTLKNQFFPLDVTDNTNIKPFMQYWIVLYFWNKYNVIVHIPSNVNSIQNILNYLKNECEIIQSLLVLYQCIDNKNNNSLNSKEIENIVEDIKSFTSKMVAN